METQSGKPKSKKRELWPYAIVTALLTFIGFIVFAVVIMYDRGVPLVADNYYEQEIVYQEQIDTQTRTQHSGRIPTLVEIDGKPKVLITFPKGGQMGQDAGKITFERPSNPTLDFSVAVNTDAQGRQVIDLSAAQPGLYLVQFDWQDAGQFYYHEFHYSFG